MQQFSKLIGFRQTIYDHALSRARDAQFELVDALPLSAPIHTLPELSCSPAFSASVGTVPMLPWRTGDKTGSGWDVTLRRSVKLPVYGPKLDC
jgi:hypothetical protein